MFQFKKGNMLSKRQQKKFDRQCKGKIAHSTREFACIQLRKSRNTQINICEVYRCKFCNKWHIGRKKK